jgi:hypothetical protein
MTNPRINEHFNSSIVQVWAKREDKTQNEPMEKDKS